MASPKWYSTFSNPKRNLLCHRMTSLLCPKPQLHFHLNRRSLFQRWFEKKSLILILSFYSAALLKMFHSEVLSKKLLSKCQSHLSLCQNLFLPFAKSERSTKKQISGFLLFLTLKFVLHSPIIFLAPNRS